LHQSGSAPDDDTTDEEEMATEVEKSFMLKRDMKTTIAMIEELCRKAMAVANTNVHENPDVETAQPNTLVESIVDSTASKCSYS
jgi:hypothetical protein